MTDRAIGKAYRAKLAAAGVPSICGLPWPEVEAMLDARARQTDQENEPADRTPLMARKRLRP